jgi:hypothetical protein
MHRILPPGLYVPLASEDTEKYRAERFIENITPENLVDLGCFYVALAMFDSTRRSVMPTQGDFRAMRREGYGIGVTALHDHGGLSAVQDALGYYSRARRPTSEALTKRVLWLNGELIALGEPISKINDFLSYGTNTNLLPEAEYTRSTAGSELIKQVINPRYCLPELDGRDAVYEFGRNLREELGRRPDRSELRTKYSGSFRLLPETYIYRYWNSIDDFWDDVETVDKAEDRQVARGVLCMVQHDLRTLGAKNIQKLSSLGLHTSIRQIWNMFGSVSAYRVSVENELRTLHELLLHTGNSEEQAGFFKSLLAAAVNAGMCIDEFVGRSTDIRDILSHAPAYVRKICTVGLDKEDTEIARMQTEDIIALCRSSRLTKSAQEFILHVLNISS